MCQISFCLSSESFEQNGNDLHTIYRNIKQLIELKNTIDSFNDLIYQASDIYMTNFYNDKPLYEILFVEHSEFGQDYKNLLIELLKLKNLNGEEIRAFIGLNFLTDYDIIYTIDDLMNNYYNYMSDIIDEDQFAVCIKKYFKNLEFQDDIGKSLKTLKGGGLELFSQDIIKSLICLNNDFKSILAENYNDVRKSLIKLSTMIGLETTIEGDADRKQDLTFNFTKDNGEKINICCEPHIKLSKSSKEGDSTFYFNRFHFHVGFEEIKGGNVLIGYIGCHL